MNRELSSFATWELQAEIERRLGAGARAPRKIKHCDECVHFKFLSGQDPSPNYNPCDLGHEMSFKMPPADGDPHDLNWGHYRIGCEDRKKITG